MATFDLPKMGEVESIVTRITNAVGFPVGFIYGATAMNPVAAFTVSDFEQRIVDTIAEVSGAHFTLGGHTSTLSQTFKPTGFLNKGFWGYLSIWAYDELGLPYSKLIKKVLGNFFIGYSIGGIFDPPIVGDTSYGHASAQANLAAFTQRQTAVTQSPATIGAGALYV